MSLSKGLCLRISLCLGLSLCKSCRINHVSVLGLSGSSLRGSGGGSSCTSISGLSLRASLLFCLSLELIILLLRKSCLDSLGRKLAGLEVCVVTKLQKRGVDEILFFEVVPQLDGSCFGSI